MTFVGVGDKHLAAQNKLIDLLAPYYLHVSKEIEYEVVNPKYILDSKQRPTITYWFDVFVQGKLREEVTYDRIGIEVDGGVGHKKTKRQHIKDRQRTKSLELEYGFLVHRFDSEQIVGYYVNPKTKAKTMHWDDSVILKALGITI